MSLRSVATTTTRPEMEVECKLGKAYIRRFPNPYNSWLGIWGIVMGPACLNKNGVWEYDLDWPDCTFWERCRYTSAAAALEVFNKYKAKLEVVA